MYNDYERQKQSFNGPEVFPVQQPIQPYGNARLLRQRQSLYQKQKQQKKQGKQQKFYQRKANRNNLSQIKGHFNAFDKLSKGVHSTANGLLSSFQNLGLMVTLIAFAAMGISKYLNNLQEADMRENAYGGDVSASGRSTGRTSAKGLQLIKNQEGFHNGTSYQDQRGIWTIGYGHTGQFKGRPVGPGMTITREEAEDLLRNDIIRFEKAVNNAVKVPISQNMFDALVSLCYNIGPGAFAASTVVKKLNAGDYKGAREAFMMWNKVEVKDKAGNKQKVVSQGLVNRRNKEMDLFGADISSDNKLKAPEINPVANNSYQTVDLKDVGKATQINGNGYRYDPSNSKMTSHTKINNAGANNFYNAGVGEMGTWNGVKITSGIGARNVTNGSKWHKGLDLAYPSGTSVKPFCSGKVTYAGVMQGFGRVVIVDDKNGYRHVYGHLSRITTSGGQKVKRSTELGKSGGSYAGVDKRVIDNYFPPHLHYGIWEPGKTGDKYYIDPRTYKYPREDDGVPTTTPQKPVKTNTPPKNKVQTPTTKNPTTQQPVKKVQTPKPKTQSKPSATTVKAPPKQTPKPNKTVKLDQPNRVVRK